MTGAQIRGIRRVRPIMTSSDDMGPLRAPSPWNSPWRGVRCDLPGEGLPANDGSVCSGQLSEKLWESQIFLRFFLGNY